MISESGLSSLLTALRDAGVGVGVAEVARLQALFARHPDLPARDARRRLGGILEAVLVKSGEDRETFARVFAAWFERAEEALRRREVAPQLLPAPPPIVPRRTKGRKLPWWSLSAAFLLLAIGLGVGRDTRWLPQAPTNLQLPAAAKSPETDRPLTAAEIRQRRFTSSFPILEVTRGTPVWSGWTALALSLLGLAAGSGIWGGFHNRRWVPERTLEPVLPGPSRVFLTPPPLRGAQLLTPRQQESLVWGIGRYVEEEPTRRLDLLATVRATARAAGIPDLHFERARYPREVWLWTDESADDPALLRLADEVEALLRTYGLPVERAVFRGLPDRLVTAEGQAFAPNEVDERRDVALVAVLTDGRLLGYQWAAADRRVRVDALLRGLSSWPRLAFVDFSDGGTALQPFLARHNIPLLAPGELAGFLGGAATPPPGVGGLAEGEIAGRSGDLAWAAVCALGPASVAEETAFDLRERLGLSTSPWALRSLRQEAPGPPGRLQWKPVLRADRLRWLLGAEEHPPDGVDPRSLLGRALDIWEEIYTREFESRRQEAGIAPWQGTPAEEHLRLERALLRLWRHPAEAAREFYLLYRGALAESIRQSLAGHAPAGWGREGRVELPWRWEALSPLSQVMLQEMGFAEGLLPRLAFGRSSRLRLGVGLCVGLGLGALGVAVASKSMPLGGQPVVEHGEGKPADAREWVDAERGGQWRVTVATRKWSASKIAESGSHVRVRWALQEHGCVERLADGTEIWRCGSIAVPPALSPEIQQSIAVLEAPPGRADVESLVLALLDSGSADTVLIRETWGKELSKLEPLWWPDGLAFPAQVIVLTDSPRMELEFGTSPFKEPDVGFVRVARGSDFFNLTAALGFDSGTLRPIQTVWSDAKIWGVPGATRAVLLRGLGPQLNNMEFVHIPAGSFMMGSPVKDRDAISSERPAHEVSLSEFWMGKTEVTNRQYRQFQPEHPGSGDLPATRVTWDEARTFCEHFGYRLPTEAEWEYACRAGTTTQWSFGDDEKQLGEYAWFEGNSREPQPVGTRKPNPWGLYDMHGNAWEWVADWYAPYSEGPQVNPTGPLEGTSRVLRGGSVYFSAGFLRSAYRLRDMPGLRVGLVGFRCARGPRRQP